jgi:O-antigen/teichoic acid export membrane protein
MPQKQKLTADLLLALIGNVIHKLLGFVIIAILARYIAKSDMGEFFFAISVATVVAMLTELGTSRYLVRAISEDAQNAAQSLESVIFLRLPLITVALLLMAISVWAIEFVSPKIFLLTSAYVLLNDFYYAFGATLVACRALFLRVLTILIGPGILVLFVFAGSELGWSFDRILVAHVVSSVVMVTMAALITRRIIGPLPRVLKIGAVRKLVAASLPFFMLGILALAHARLDEVMLAALKTYEDVANYSASYKLLEVSQFVIRPLTMVLFPVLVAAAARRSWPEYRKKALHLVLGAATVGLALSVIVVPGAYLIVPVIFGPDYQSSVPITRILFLAAPALFAGQAAVLLALALHLDRKAIIITACGLIGNGLLNLAVIPRWGAVGAAWTTLVSETLVAVILVAAILIYLHRELVNASQEAAIPTVNRGGMP